MANYDLRTITPEQALAYNAATDSISGSADPVELVITFDEATGRVAITDTLANRTVVFGPGVYGERFQLDSGRTLLLGSQGADFISLFATRVAAGGGDDTLAGGSPQHLSGGAGRDLFAFYGSAVLRGTILDWEAVDQLYLGGIEPADTNYLELTAAHEAEADTLAQQRIAAGAADYVVVAVGPDLFVYADSRGDNGEFEAKIRIAGRGLNDVSPAAIRSGPSPTGMEPPPQPSTGPPEPTPPASGPVPAGFTNAVGTITGNMEAAHIGRLSGAEVTIANVGYLQLRGPHAALDMGGVRFAYDASGHLTSADVFSIHYRELSAGAETFRIQISLLTSAAQFSAWVQADATQTAFQSIFGLNDSLRGGDGSDLILGFGGGDFLQGFGGADSLFGGDGDDSIYALAAPGNAPGLSAASGGTFLRGQEGNDFIVGGPGFDDVHGNLGNDTARGGAGDDWVVGGKDNDLLFGDAGGDLVYGNLGDDTCVGGEGADIVRGGQGADQLWGSSGADFISGDRGDDTVTGGAGADIFHGSQDAGIDRVADFNSAQGDRVQLDPGTTYTLRQQGADTVIDMGGGHQMILVGVQLSSLPPGWIFGA